jgi:hypothetical protein
VIRVVQCVPEKSDRYENERSDANAQENASHDVARASTTYPMP